ncbi:hypothetical protein U9M48_030287 [Paspalum notatum var. saurae]|uniref:Retrotransposon gag domain-containing protein n=1 Tax=Paspalum notatum var. saurae TaxID=547442 RepID=A0AAQ3X3L5_PASNO
MASHNFGNGLPALPEGQGESNHSNEDGSPPSPPPSPPLNPYLELVQALVTHAQNMRNTSPRPLHDKSLSKMSEFLRLKPPSFSGSQDPMEAEDWMRTIERKLELLNCDEQTKIALATHQLSGTALAWWEIVKAPHKNGITWKEFTKAFRQHHVPEATKDLKAEEFRHLTQGNSTVTEYI